MKISSLMRIAGTALALCMLFVACSGSSGDSKAEKAAAQTEHKNGIIGGVDSPYFAKVKHPLTIQRAETRRTYYVNGKEKDGTPPKFVFRVCNHNIETVSVQEWRTNEAENLRVMTAPCEKGKSSSVRAEDWKQIWPSLSENGKKDSLVHRTPSVLAPENFVTLEIPLLFLNGYKLNKTEETLAVKVELNLQSVEAEPLIFEIAVRQKKQRIKEYIIAD